MRISTSTIYDLGIAGVQQQTSSLIKVQQQISTGRRIQSPADDPVAAARVLEVSQSKALSQQFDVNTDSATTALSLEETALANVSSVLLDIRDVIVSAGNPAMDHNNLTSMATALRGSYQELMGLANGTDSNGLYMFSGYKGTTQPFSETTPGTVTYNGDQGQRLIQISPSRQVPVSDAGADIFMQIKNGNGTFVTAAGAGNTGTGQVSVGTVLDPAKWAAVVDKNLTVSFSVDNSVVPPVTTYDVSDGAGSIIGGPRPYVSGSTIDLTTTPPDYGIQLSVKGAPANGDTFTVQASSNESIFTTLNNLITALETAIVPSNQTALINNLNTALTNLDNGLNRVLTVRASVGARMNEVDSVKSAGQDTALQYDQTLSSLQDLDYARAISDLTRQQANLEAAQKSFLKIQDLSLFNFIS